MRAFYLHVLFFFLTGFATLPSGTSYVYSGKVYISRKKVGESYRSFAVDWEWKDDNGFLDIYMTNDDE